MEGVDAAEVGSRDRSWAVQRAYIPAYVRLTERVTDVVGSMTLVKSGMSNCDDPTLTISEFPNTRQSVVAGVARCNSGIEKQLTSAGEIDAHSRCSDRSPPRPSDA